MYNFWKLICSNNYIFPTGFSLLCSSTLESIVLGSTSNLGIFLYVVQAKGFVSFVCSLRKSFLYLHTTPTILKEIALCISILKWNKTVHTEVHCSCAKIPSSVNSEFKSKNLSRYISMFILTSGSVYSVSFSVPV